MMGMDFLLSAFGVTPEQAAKLREIMDPEKINAMVQDFARRFDAMEARNAEMHMMISAIYADMGNASPGRMMDHMMLEAGALYRDITPPENGDDNERSSSGENRSGSDVAGSDNGDASNGSSG